MSVCETDVKVKVSKSGNARNLIMYYDDPVTGKRCQKSTNTCDRHEALKKAGEWEANLKAFRKEQRNRVHSNMTNVLEVVAPGDANGRNHKLIWEVDDQIEATGNEVNYAVFCHQTGTVKLGWTSHSVRERIIAFNGQGPLVLTFALMAAAPGTFETEQDRNRRLAEDRVPGTKEWFNLSREVKIEIIEMQERMWEWLRN